MGIIGHTQGVNSANNPPIKPAKKMNQYEVEDDSSEFFFTVKPLFDR